MQLICLLPFCLITILFKFCVQQARCTQQIPNSAFPLDHISGGAYHSRLVCMVCVHFFCSSFRDVRSRCVPCMLAYSFLPLAWTSECSTVFLCGHGTFCSRTVCTAAQVSFTTVSAVYYNTEWYSHIKALQTRVKCFNTIRKSLNSSCRLLSTVESPASRTRCSPVHPKPPLSRGKLHRRGQRRAPRRVPVKSLRAGASQRRTVEQNTRSEWGAPPLAKTLRVRTHQSIVIYKK